MSDFRRACVIHQPLFFKNDIYHANLLYTRWNTHRTKRIYSRRLGISYEETIHARDRHSITHLNNKHIYRKKLSNFCIRCSHNPRVSKTQEIRFDQAKRRIFHKKEHNPLNLIRHKLATAQRYWFMFSDSQFVLKPIKHLLYNHGLHHRNYKFWTPFFGRSGKRITTTTLDDTSSPNINYTVAPYNPIPNMFIPHKYRNIIPKEPLYTEEGVYIVPGSREWFTYMYNLHINLSPPLTKAQRREKNKLERIRLDKKEASFHGSSFNRYPTRKHLAFTLTRINERFHEEMMDYTNQYLASDDEKIKSDIYKIMSDFTIRFIKGSKGRVSDVKRACYLPPGATVDTSDDAKELELRPKKRRLSSNTNLYPLIDNTERFKRRRFYPAVMDDSTGAELY
ncbi:uncharacterized protein OCT59_022598 [Rhizophagus irregularis]|uniref:DUF8211 domain-containing protein n=3 Tax=Rhizophagus irregularis TaxID=588596 RepID=U9T4V6_RHIID|nr:hypothetical protein OCT59_022598 [Rhizophagus irregularis]